MSMRSVRNIAWFAIGWLAITLIGIFFMVPRSEAQVPEAKPKFIFTCQPRNQTQVDINGFKIDDTANWQHANDIGRWRSQSEADLCYEEAPGVIHILHDCTSSPTICSAQEGRMSIDGSKVYYAVQFGNTLTNSAALNGVTLKDVKDFATVTSEIWEYDFITKTKRRLSSGHIDRAPSPLSPDYLVFASDRAGTWAPQSTGGRNFYDAGPAFHIWRARIAPEGLTDFYDITPAEHFATNPEVTSWGGVLYSSFWGVSPREFGTTPQNHWVMCEVNANGSDQKCRLGAHGSGSITNRAFITDWVDLARGGEQHSTIKALSGFGEIHIGQICSGNYYRSNPLGRMGKIFCIERIDAEGASLEKNIPAMLHWATAGNPGSGRYVPSSFWNATPGAQDQDMDPIFHKDGRAAGRAGYPFPVPDAWYGPDAWGYTRMRGFGAEYATPQMATVAAMGGEPTAKKQIDIAMGPQVKNPFDTAQSLPVACTSINYHCWDARAKASYLEVMGIEKPTIAPIKRAGKVCQWRTVNGFMSELMPATPPPRPPGYTDEQYAALKLQLMIAFQGNADPNYPVLAADGGGQEIMYFDHWPRKPDREGLYRTYPGQIAKFHSDGSAISFVDCGRPYQHFGVDKNGKRIANGLMPLVSMGNEHCHGCHDGHSEERMGQLNWDSAAQRFKTTEAAKELPAGC